MKKTIGILIGGALLMAGCSCATDIKKINDLETRIQVIENKTGITAPAKNLSESAQPTQEVQQKGAEVATTDSPTKKDIQTALKNAGCYDGELDGKFGPRTKKSIEEFQVAQGLRVDGKVGPNTWDKLKTYLNAATTTSNATTETAKGV